MDKIFLSKAGAVALNGIFGYEPELSHRLIERFGSPEAVFLLPEKEREKLFGPYSKFLPRIGEAGLEAAGKLVSRLESNGYRILTICDELYPPLLKECQDAPAALFLRSSSDDASIFNGRPMISIVGTRDLSPYGKEWCTRIVQALSESPAKPCIVSGMAIGVDITAHMAALAYGLPTIGVLPVGIDDIYPRRHSVAAQKVANSPGSGLVTDFLPGTGATRFNFLRRNRIIAGMSSATILIESKSSGGGMLTARLAFDYGRDVFALPGRIDDKRSAGCNMLLKEKIAEPVTSLQELAESLGLGRFNVRKKTDLAEAIESRYSGGAEAEMLTELKDIAGIIRGKRGISFEELCSEHGYTYPEVTRLAGILERDGFIEVDLLQRCAINAKKL